MVKNQCLKLYDIDKNELDGDLDWPAPTVATIYAIVNNSEPEFLGEIRAYNWKTYWLSTSEYDEVDTAENWWSIINGEYKKLLKGRQIKMSKTGKTCRKRFDSGIWISPKFVEEGVLLF